MNSSDARYARFALVREMLETPEIIARFDFGQARDTAEVIRRSGRLMLTGEGSSRLFPAGNLIYEVLRLGVPLSVCAEGARQAQEYNLAESCIFAASNSGQTKEVIALFTQLAAAGHQKRFGLTAQRGTKLEAVSNQCYTLSCGKEAAVAATKSVVEQALFYRALLCCWERGHSPMLANQQEAAAKARETLEAELDADIVAAIAAAPVVYFAGRSNGVAGELTLKTNEIARKKSDYLEGTYAVHGIEEVMDRQEVVIVIDPFPAEAEKFRQVLCDGVGMKVVALASEPTIFPTIRVPNVEGYRTVLQLLAGWNLLVHVGVALGINLDKPQRARKVGNEFVG